MIFKTEKSSISQTIVFILMYKSLTSAQNTSTTTTSTPTITTTLTTAGLNDTNNSSSLAAEQVSDIADELNRSTGGQLKNSRTGRDLVYESMKMRSGNWKPRSPDDQVRFCNSGQIQVSSNNN